MKISFTPKSPEHGSGCQECAVNMPTGTLQVNTEKEIDRSQFQDFIDYVKAFINRERRKPAAVTAPPEHCSLIFVWTSQALKLQAPSSATCELVKFVPVYVDFIPALRPAKNNQTKTKEGLDYVVPKRCCVCTAEDPRNWRKSCCTSEIDYISKTMKEKHKKCFKILKCILYTIVNLDDQIDFVDNYHLKNIVLNHDVTCKSRHNTSEDCVECVLEILCQLKLAYKNKDLKSFVSKTNLIPQSLVDYSDLCAAYEKVIKELVSIENTDTYETFVKKLNNLKFDK